MLDLYFPEPIRLNLSYSGGCFGCVHFLRLIAGMLVIFTGKKLFLWNKFMAGKK